MADKSKVLIGIGAITTAVTTLLLWVRGAKAGPSEPSTLLFQYQDALEAAVNICESDNPNRYVNIPGYGLILACPAITQLEALMVQEAINIGMISSEEEAYFVGAVMYDISGDTIVPYWWQCPYCSETFRSPEKRAAHIDEAHWDILVTRGTITNIAHVGINEISGVIVTWRNDSPFNIMGHVEVIPLSPTRGAFTAIHNQDTTLLPNQSIGVELDWDYSGQSNVELQATLRLAGAPLPGMFLDQSVAYFEVE